MFPLFSRDIIPFHGISVYKKTVKGSDVPRNFFSGGGSKNSVEDRGQRERRSGDGSTLVRGSTQFANE
jgi:hypothetical protein